MAIDPFSTILEVGSKIIDKLIPDKAEADKMKFEMMKLEQEGSFTELKTRMSAIIAEAQSDDPWTSRARPSFLYVIYIYILAAIPVGILSVFSPDIASAIANGTKEWLNAIPVELWGVFGAGYLGYTTVRSVFDKKRK